MDFVSVYDLLIPSNMIVLKGKTVHKINGLMWGWSINMVQYISDTVFMFEIFYPQSNTGLKASLALMHMITFILRSANLEWQEKEFVTCNGVYFNLR